MTGGYGKDLNNVFWDGRIVKDADPKTFVTFVQYSFAKDKNHVYWRTGTIPSLDTSTFAPIDSTYVKDFNGVYFVCPGGDCVIKLEGADRQTFEVVQDG
ncbi:MAG: DKNYY domain-containing protein, partial [Patescibacteria group bacterium]